MKKEMTYIKENGKSRGLPQGRWAAFGSYIKLKVNILWFCFRPHAGRYKNKNKKSPIVVVVFI